MSFGLKNLGAIYQRLVNKMFSRQIGRNMEVYVDDMLVKSKEEDTHLDVLKETFTTLRQYQMRWNPNKCAFGVSSGKFLGFMVSQWGIESNLERYKPYWIWPLQRQWRKYRRWQEGSPFSTDLSQRLQTGVYPSSKLWSKFLPGQVRVKKPFRSWSAT